MEQPGCRDEYPVATVVVSNLVPLLIYAIGTVLVLGFGIVYAAAYMLFVVFLEIRLLAGHCPDCYYYGKTCAFGKGRLSPLLSRKGDPARFVHRTITGKDMLPDFLVFIIPVLAGIVLMVLAFSWIVLTLTAALLVLGFAGNALVRGQLACPHCRQREIGCPAERLFNKTRQP